MSAFIRVHEFDLWRPGYALASVEVLIAGTTNPATLYSDTDLSTALPNPQRLQAKQESDGTAYGRFAQPVYVGTNYHIRVSGIEQTGVEQLPLTTLAGATATTAVVTATGGAVSRTLAAHAANEVYVANYGALGDSASANTTILAAAVGAAAAQGGGRVLLPSGNYTFTQLSLPQDVRLVGKGRAATTLRSEQAAAVITATGDGAGLEGLTLDGVNLNAGSIGLFAIGRDRLVLEDVIIKRFAQGVLTRGGEQFRFRDLHVSNCTKGVDLRGDRDALLSSTGGPLRDAFWDGGSVDTCTDEGLRLSFEDDPVLRVTVRGVRLFDNTGPAVVINGARVTTFESCWWFDNTDNLSVDDDDDASRADENTVKQLLFWNCSFEGGENAFDGLCEDVRFDGCDFADVDWTLSVPTLPVMLLDCTEDSASTASGALDRLMRNSTHKIGEFPGVTTDNSWTTAWQTELEPGEVIRVNARIIGRQRNGENWASYEFRATCRRPGSALSFSSASATLVVGTVVTGGTSGAEARVVAVSGTTSGTLTLRSISGAFINGEALTFSDTKTATAASVLVPASAILVGQDFETGHEADSDWDVSADVLGNSAIVKVKGDTDQTVEWICETNVLRP